MAYTWPLPPNSVISQRFGSNPYSPVQPSGHTGMDFAVSSGTSVKAIGNGTVLWADWATKMSPSNPWYIAPGFAGIVVLINHGDVISVSAHLSATNLNAGARVTQGQEIGKSGNTGLSSGPHLHFEIIPQPTRVVNALYGRVDPLNYISAAATPAAVTPLAANQRRVGGANVNQRAEATTGSKVVRVINANTVETFSGWVEGESVTIAGVPGVRHAFTSNIWYKDSAGYVWAGGFTEQKTAGLPDQTPPKLAANQRKVIPGGAIQRSAPERAGTALRNIAGNTTETFSGFVRGEKVTSGGISSDIWFKDSKGYVWVGGFTSHATAGLPDQTPPKGTRYSGNAAIAYRTEPKLNAKVDRYLPANTSFVFDAYTHGDSFEGSDIWFRGRENKFWAHSKLFTSQSTDGLTEVKVEAPKPAPAPTPVPTPAPAPAPVSTVREVVPEGVRVRTTPSLGDSNIEAVVPGGNTVTVAAYVEATEVSGSKIWFALPTKGYVHASGLKDPSTKGLQKREVVSVEPETAETYSFTPDFDFVEYKPANYWNMGDGNFPANPEKLVIHQFDAKAKKPSIEGVINHFQNPRKDNPTSAHFAVSGKRIVQSVSLKDRAFHAGSVGNSYIGIEVDPQEDADTVASVKKLISALNKKYGKVFTYTKHRDVPGNATECGADIHLDLYKVSTPTPAPKPTPEVPTPVVPPVKTEPTKEQIQFVLDYLLRVNSK